MHNQYDIHHHSKHASPQMVFTQNTYTSPTYYVSVIDIAYNKIKCSPSATCHKY